MRSAEEKEIRTKLRANKTKRAEVKAQFDAIRAEKLRLREERAELMKKAEQMGVQIGKKKAAA